MPRGRLIFPFLARIARIDTVATEADPDAAGPLTSGYDDVFREPVMVPASGDDRLGSSARVEATPISVRCQVEPEQFEVLQQMVSGDAAQGRFHLVLHFKDLEDAGLVEASGHAAIRKGDRLVGIDRTDGTLVQEVPDPPGLYVHEALPRGMGLSLNNAHRNLLLLTFRSRDKSVSG